MSHKNVTFVPDGYLMNEKEIQFKTLMWMRVNADYLKDKVSHLCEHRKCFDKTEHTVRQIHQFISPTQKV